MKNNILYIGLLISLAVVFSPACASEPRWIAVVDSQSGEPYQTIRETAIQSLKDMGYSPDMNLYIREYNLARFEGTVRRIWREIGDASRKPDLILLNGTAACIAFREIAAANPRLNFLFAGVTDPLGTGLIENFTDPPKHNFTGVSYFMPVKERLLFLKRIMPNVKNIGLIHSDMPQSKSYNQWLTDTIHSEPEFQGWRIFFREIPFVGGENGYQRMARMAGDYLAELDPQVDVFLAPNDQLGAQASFFRSVYPAATKPLMGNSRADIMERWGGAMSIYPSLEGIGEQAAKMMKKLLDGVPLRQIVPENPRNFGMAFDADRMRKFGLEIPEEFLKQAGDNIAGRQP